MRYLIYVRVSTDEQDNETQLRIAKEYLNRIHPKGDYECIIFDEGDLSTGVKYTKRPQLQKMLEAVRNDDVVIVYTLDRLARDIIEMVTAHRDITRKGATVYSLTGEHSDEFSITIMAAIAQQTRKFIRLKTKDKLQTKKQKGERYSRFLPYGYGLHETKLVPIKVGNEIVMKRGVLVPVYEEQQVLSRMYQFSAEGMSHSQIATALKHLGYMNREGKPFQKMSIYRILSRTEQTKSSDQLQEESAVLAFR